GADLARHAGDFGGERVQLVHHGVDGVLEFEDFPFNIHRDLAGQVAFGHRGGHVGDVADLCREIAGHGVDAVGQVLPGAGDAFHFRLAAHFGSGADLAGHAGDFGSKGAELVHHGVDGVLEFQDFAFDIHGDFAGKVSFGHGGGDTGDVAHLRGKIAGHGVEVVGVHV